MSGWLCAPYLKDTVLWQCGLRSSLGIGLSSGHVLKQRYCYWTCLLSGGRTAACGDPVWLLRFVKQSILIHQLLFQFPSLRAGPALSSSLIAAGSLLLDGTLRISESFSLLNVRSGIFQSVLAYGKDLNFKAENWSVVKQKYCLRQTEIFSPNHWSII